MSEGTKQSAHKPAKKKTARTAAIAAKTTKKSTRAKALSKPKTARKRSAKPKIVTRQNLKDAPIEESEPIIISIRRVRARVKAKSKTTAGKPKPRVKAGHRLNRGWALALCVTVFIAVVISAGFWIVDRSFSSPAQGVINIQPPMQTNPTAESETSVASGKYISFNYPSSFKTRAVAKPANNLLESFSFNTIVMPFTNMDITITNLPGGSLNADSGYVFRLQNPGLYKPDTVFVSNQTFQAFIDQTSSYGIVAYAPSGSWLATISLTGSGAQTDQIGQTLKTVLASLKWN